MAASTNYTELAYNKESIFGEYNSAPAFTVLPTTGGSPVNNVTTAVSEVIRSDRQTDDLVVVDGEISGDINYELSYAPYKDFMGSVLMNQSAPRTISITNVSNQGSSGDDAVIGNSGIEAACLIGDVVRLTSATDSSIDGEYVIVASASNEVTVYPPTGAGSDLTDLTVDATEIQVNGADPIEGYTIRKKAKSGATDYFWYYKGCAINTMNFNFATGSILNGSLGIVGLTEETGTATLPGQVSDVSTPAYSIMNSVSSVGVIRIGGVSLGSCTFSSLDLTIDNQINAAKSIGTLGACDLAAFSLMVTGNTEVYFNNLDLYNKFLAASSFDVTIITTDGDGNSLGINIPKCKFETLDTPISGKDSFLMQSGTLKGLRDETGDYMIKITRIDA